MASSPITNRKIENPYWANKEREHIIAEFYYPDTDKRVTASIMNDGNNRDYKEILKNFSIEQLDANTNRRKELRDEEIKRNDDRRKADMEKVKQEQLFAAKLDAFEIDVIKNSSNRKMKSKIRKAKSVIEITALAAILMTEESANVE